MAWINVARTAFAGGYPYVWGATPFRERGVESPAFSFGDMRDNAQRQYFVPWLNNPNGDSNAAWQAAKDFLGYTEVARNGIPGFISLALVNQGVGYTIGDVLTVVGGTFTTAAQIQVTNVSGGKITAAIITVPGDYSVFPANPVSVTGGTGNNATFNLTPIGAVPFPAMPLGTKYLIRHLPHPLPSTSLQKGLLPAPAATWQFAKDITRWEVSREAGFDGTGTGRGREAIMSVTYSAVPYAIMSNLDLTSANNSLANSTYAIEVYVFTGGGGYSVGDVLTISGGTFQTAAQVRVTSVTAGVVTHATLINPGNYSVFPPQPTNVTGGGGAGAEFTLISSLAPGLGVLFPDEASLARYVYSYFEPGGKWQLFKGFSTINFDRDRVPLVQEENVLLNDGDLFIDWFQIPVQAVPITAIQNCIGKTNKYPLNSSFGPFFNGPSIFPKAVPKETLIMATPKFDKPYRMIDGNFATNIRYRFKYKPYGANFFYRPNPPKFTVPVTYSLVSNVAGTNVRITVSSTTQMVDNDWVEFSSNDGIVYETWQIKIVDNTHVDLIRSAGNVAGNQPTTIQAPGTATLAPGFYAASRFGLPTPVPGAPPISQRKGLLYPPCDYAALFRPEP